MAAEGGKVASRELGILVGTAWVALAITGLLAPVVAEISFLFPGELPSRPYFVPGHAPRLYLALPLFAASVVYALLAPGILLALSLGHRSGDSWAEVVVRGFLLAYAARTAGHTIAKLAGLDLTASTFWIVEVLTLAGASVAVALVWRHRGLDRPTGSVRHLFYLALIPAVVSVLLLPPIFWQDFTEDGLEALEIGRSLGGHVVPRFPNSSGFMGLGIGMLTMAPPVSWFIQLLGTTEAAARIPLLLYLPVAALTLVALSERDREQRIGIRGEVTIMLVLAAFVAVMGFSATYDRYAADTSAPTAFETLTLTCLSGALLALWQRRLVTFLAFVLLAYFARPTGLMLVLLLGVATAAVWRGEERRTLVGYVAAALAACAVAVVVYEKIYLPWASGGALSFAAESVLERYTFLSFFDLRRFLWVMIPGGFLPFISLFALKRQDLFSRQLSLVLIAYFLAFYFPAFVALHHFAPVMVLPVVVFLRLAGDGPTWIGRAGVLACSLGLLLSAPHHFHVDRSSRSIGERFHFGVGEYGGPWDQHRLALGARDAVFQIFPATWDVADASRTRVGAGLPFLYYAARSRIDASEADYLVLAEGEAPVAGFVEAGRSAGAVVYMRSRAVLERDLAQAPTTDFGNPLFVLPPETLFSFVGGPAGAYDLDMNQVPVLWRFF